MTIDRFDVGHAQQRAETRAEFFQIFERKLLIAKKYYLMLDQRSPDLSERCVTQTGSKIDSRNLGADYGGEGRTI